MKASIWVALMTALAMCLCVKCYGQANVPSALTYTWPAAATGTAGQSGNYLIFNGTTAPRPGNYTIDVSVSGTAPATCTFRVEGSSDTVNWYGLDATAPATTSCTANFMESIAGRPVIYLRINLTYTQGDGTTKVQFHYTGGRS
jgi:hypothetical protein